MIAYRIKAGDTTRLAVLVGPEHGAAFTQFLELWDPGGSQPPNSHPRSTETFLFLAGSGVATSDGVSRPVAAGDVLVLPAGSVHRIESTGDGPMAAIVTMEPDDGFAAFVRRGVPEELGPEDAALVASAFSVPSRPLGGR